MSHFSANALQRIASGRLSLDWPQPMSAHRGDFDLNETWSTTQDAGSLRQAAVLIPVREALDSRQAEIILTRRTEHLPSHAGQVAFPGGKIEAEDDTPLAAALREAEEEIGLDRSHVNAIGYLEPYITSSGFQVHPVIALVAEAASITPDPNEVAEVFNVPLQFLMSPGNHQVSSRQWKGHERFFYVMPYDRHYIWGVTAGIIRLMYERLYLEC